MDAYYGDRPSRSYFLGCSEGGREGLLLSQRYPKEFDGIVAGAPVMDGPRMGFKDVYIAETLAKVAEAQGVYDSNGLPFLNKTFTDADLALVQNHVLAKCDRLDGVEDGMTANFPECQRKVDFDELECQGGKLDTCLSAQQVTAMKKLSRAYRNNRGRTVCMRWYWDQDSVPGIRSTWLGDFNAPGNSAGVMTFSALVNASVFTTPPTRIDLTVPGVMARYQLDFDLDEDAELGFTTSGIYKQSSDQLFNARSTDMDGWAKADGKLIVYIGQSDPAVFARSPVEWMERLHDRYGEKRTGKFARLFTIPGMGHCSGGPATDKFDSLAAIENWVERGQAPGPDHCNRAARESRKSVAG